jgi:hypothetical protein
MTREDRPLALGEALPDLSLQTADGGALRLSSLRGHPLLAVCVRYYG